MINVNSSEVRKTFLDFFVEKGHKKVESSGLVPINDPTLMFSNSGMNQFKDVFLGTEKINFDTATSSQKCVRAGGKHNDLDNVGFTLRHHTFFEMLGNFSFGDYFKEKAIGLAWELLTEKFKLDKDKLWVTVHVDDQESEDIWLNKIKIPAERLSRLTEDNFWSMGDTGPCGPCSEIFYDHGEDLPGEAPQEGVDTGERFVEIYNLVFMQFNRDHNGKLSNLPKKCVDTGMGLERITAVIQKTSDNYKTDIFKEIIDSIAEVLSEKNLENPSLRVIADHLRSSVFLISDGVNPSNEGRGYVLRRIIRRALTHAYKINNNKDFSFSDIFDSLGESLLETYPNVKRSKSIILEELKLEEDQFRETLKQGMKLLEEEIKGSESKTLSGDVIFKLYDTYGFPVDLTRDLAQENDLSLDLSGYEKLMAVQRANAKKENRFEALLPAAINLSEETKFIGYKSSSSESEIKLIFKDGKEVQSVSEGQCMIVLDSTPFYGESGGQVGDKGKLISKDLDIEVLDTQKIGNFHLHISKVIKGSIKLNSKVNAEIDEKRRNAIVSNHSATHLMHSALRNVLGEHVQQKGSLVNEEKLRFDFSHKQKLSESEISKIEQEVNQAIKSAQDTQIIETSIEESKKLGAIAFFGEKYGDQVRVLKIAGDYSIELCGGTHVKNSSEIKSFKIISETSISSGIRRIEAISGDLAIKDKEEIKTDLLNTAETFNVSAQDLPGFLKDKIKLVNIYKEDLKKVEQKIYQSLLDDMKSSYKSIGEINVILKRIDNLNLSKLRGSLDSLKNEISNLVVILVGSMDEKSTILASVSNEISATYDARNLLDSLSKIIGAKGGGKADFAQAGGPASDKLDEILIAAEKIFNKV
ncbi:MAG: alanine--tRNA ligase [Gammaproteobacteria bacterium]|nr:MAG: alanine--tRNA ligase [Gammaproteobacteria bacterium]